MGHWKWALVIRKIIGSYRIIEHNSIVYQNPKLQSSLKSIRQRGVLHLKWRSLKSSSQRREVKFQFRFLFLRRWLERIYLVREKKVNQKVQAVRNHEVIRGIVKSNNGCKNVRDISQRFTRNSNLARSQQLSKGKLKMKKQKKRVKIKRRQHRHHRDQ